MKPAFYLINDTRINLQNILSYLPEESCTKTVESITHYYIKFTHPGKSTGLTHFLIHFRTKEERDKALLELDKFVNLANYK